MRDLLTALAIGVILLLSVALVGPYFVDWNSYRGEVARLVSRAIDRPVSIGGDLSLRLLPTPSVTAGEVTIGEPDGQGRLRVRALSATLALPAMLRGEVSVTGATLDEPVLDLPRLSTTAKPADVTPAPVRKVAVRSIVINDGRLVDAEGREMAHAIGGEGEITDLRGPMKGQFRFITVGRPKAVRFSLGTLDNAGRMRIRALLEDEALAARLEADGQLVTGQEGGLGYEGQLTGSGNLALARDEGFTQVVWRMTGAARAAYRGATVDALEVRLGADPASISLTGVADIAFDPRLSINATLAARQIDLDRLLGEAERPRPQVPVELLRSVAERLTRGDAAPELPHGQLDLTVGSLLLGGEPLGGVRLALASGDKGLRLAALDAALPGRTTLTAAPGSLDATNSLRLSAETRDARKLSTWFHGSQQQASPFETAAISGEATIHDTGLRFSDAVLTLDRSRLTGSVALGQVREGGERRPRIEAVLRSDLLDIVTLPELGGGGDTADYDITLDAARVQYRGVGTGRITARAVKTGASLQVEKLSIADLGGASVEAAGQFSGAGAEFRATVDASRIDALSALVQRVAPPRLAEALRSRAADLAPMRLTVTGRQQPGAAGLERNVVVDGWLGETRIVGSARLDQDGRLLPGDSLSGTINSATSGQVLRQLGIEAISLTGAGPTQLLFALSGAEPARALSVKLAGRIGGADLALDGALTFSDEAHPGFDGRLTVNSADISPLAQQLLITVPVVPPGTALRAGARLRFEDFRITLANLAMDVAGQPVRGEIAFNLLEFGRIAGQLKTRRLDARLVAPLVFGADVAGPTNRPPWLQQPFGPVRQPPLPGDVWLEADELVLGDGVMVQDPRLVFRFERGLVFLDHVSARTAGGTLKGQVTLRRAAAQVQLAGRFTAGDVDLQRLLPGGAGRLAGTIDISTSGATPGALLAQAAGVARLQLTGLTLPALDPGALSRLVLTAQPDSARVDAAQVAEALQKELQRAPLRVPALDLPVSINAGLLRGGPVSLGKQPALELTFAADLARQTVESRVQISDARVPKDWPGAAPQAGVLWRGPLLAPERSLDVGPLANGLTALALARELDRIELLEQDARERAFFNRRLKASQDERRREEEEQRREEEQARRAAEERRREEAQRRAEEDRQRREEERLRRSGEPLPLLPPLQSPAAAPPR